jgi:hypothetical protein
MPCIRCKYDVTGLPDGHLCPECAEPIVLRRYRQVWRDQLHESRDTLSFGAGTLCVGHLLTLAAIAVYIHGLLSTFTSGIVDLDPFFGGVIGIIAAIVCAIALIMLNGPLRSNDTPPRTTRHHRRARGYMKATAILLGLALLLLPISMLGDPLSAVVFTLPVATILLSLAFVSTCYTASWLLDAIHILSNQPPATTRKSLRLLLLGPLGAALLTAYLSWKVMADQPSTPSKPTQTP